MAAIIHIPKYLAIIIQHIVTMPKCGHGALNIRRLHTRDNLRYT